MNAPALTPQCLSHLSYSKFQFYILIWSQEVKARLELSCHTLKTLISNFFSLNQAEWISPHPELPH